MLYVCTGSKTFVNISMYLSFIMHLPEDGHMSGRNMQEVYGMSNTLSYSYCVHLLVWILYLIAQRKLWII